MENRIVCGHCGGELDEHSMVTGEGVPVCGDCLDGYLTGTRDDVFIDMEE